MNEESQKLDTLLSEEEQAIIHRAIAEDNLSNELLSEILNQPKLTKEEKRNLLISDVVDPYRTVDDFIKRLKKSIKKYKHQFLVCPSTETRPKILYSVGCIDRFNGELLFVGNVSFDLIGHAFNYITEEFEKDGFKEDVGSVLLMEDNTTPIRYRFLKLLVKDHTKTVLTVFPRLYPEFDPQTPLYVFEVGDANNHLPGEDGYDDSFLQYTHIRKFIE